MVLAEFKSHPRRSGQPWAFAVKKNTIDSSGVCVSLKGINIYNFFRSAFIRLSNRTIDESYNRGGPSCNCKGQTIPNPFSCYISQSICITYAKLRDHFYHCHLHGWIVILDHQNIFTFECIPPALKKHPDCFIAQKPNDQIRNHLIKM